MRSVLAAVFCVACGAASAQQLGAAVSGGPPYDVVANCLTKAMSVQLNATPVVHPPPANRAEVHLFLRGGDIALPVASFFVSQSGEGPTVVRFEERDDVRGRYAVAAQAAATLCVK
jgi:hypothetical protein